MILLQINASYKPAFIYGGPTMSVSKLSEVLIRQGVNLEVLTTQANGDGELSVPLKVAMLVDGVPVTYYKRLTKDHTHFSPALYWALSKKIAETRNQEAENKLLVHIHTWWNLVSVFSCLIALLKGTRVVLSPRGTLSSYSFGNRNNLFKQLIFALSKPMFRRCHFHATSENEKLALFKIIKPKSITVIANIVNLPTQISSFRTQAAGHPIKLLFFSRIEQKKGLELLFQALNKIDFDYKLTIAGPGDSGYIKQLQALALDLNIDENIDWIGNQAPEHKFEIMSAHDILVLPSHDENFANVVVESLFVGTPVVITKNVGLSDYVIHNDFGWVCEFDQKDLIQKLRLSAKESVKRTRIREQAPLKIKEDFSERVLARQYIDLYNRILNDV